MLGILEAARRLMEGIIIEDIKDTEDTEDIGDTEREDENAEDSGDAGAEARPCGGGKLTISRLLELQAESEFFFCSSPTAEEEVEFSRKNAITVAGPDGGAAIRLSPLLADVKAAGGEIFRILAMKCIARQYAGVVVLIMNAGDEALHICPALNDERPPWPGGSMPPWARAVDAALKGKIDLQGWTLSYALPCELTPAPEPYGAAARAEDEKTPGERMEERADGVAEEIISRRRTGPERMHALLTPKAMKRVLDRYIMGQEEAKKAACTIVFKAMKGSRTNALFMGPSGCGKTEIFRRLSDIYPHIHITNVANVTQDGWSGGKKVTSVFQEMAALGMKPEDIERSVIVLDEFDKMAIPKHNSRGENVSTTVQSEYLHILEGHVVTVPDRDRGDFMVDTSRISFVCVGAFTEIYAKYSEQAGRKPFGFGQAEPAAGAPAADVIGDLSGFGVTPELLGRIDCVCLLDQFDEGAYRELLASDKPMNPIVRLSEKYGAELVVSEAGKDYMVKEAAKDGLGIRRIYSILNSSILEGIYNEGRMPSSGPLRIFDSMGTEVG